MALARLWEGFRWPDGTMQRTFAVIMTNAQTCEGKYYRPSTEVVDNSGYNRFTEPS
jgi:hypothetical protein